MLHPEQYMFSNIINVHYNGLVWIQTLQLLRRSRLYVVAQLVHVCSLSVKYTLHTLCTACL